MNSKDIRKQVSQVREDNPEDSKQFEVQTEDKFEEEFKSYKDAPMTPSYQRKSDMVVSPPLNKEKSVNVASSTVPSGSV